MAKKMKIIKNIVISLIFFVTLSGCVSKPANSEVATHDSVTSDASDILSDGDTGGNDTEADFSGAGEFFKPDPSRWPKK